VHLIDKAKGDPDVTTPPQGPPPPYGEQQPGQPYGQQPGQPYGQQPGQPYGQPAQPYGSMPPPPFGAMAGTDQVTLPNVGTVTVASIGQRFVGRLLDFLIVGIPSAIIAFAIIAATASNEADRIAAGESTASGSFYASIFAVAGVLFVLGILYEVGLIATRGATLGKQIAGVKVLRIGDGQLPGWGPSFLRWIIPAVANFVCGLLTLLVYLSPLFDSSGRRQGWHDKVAKTIVISVK